MYCTKCGANLPDDSSFCTHCGYHLHENVPQPVAAPSVQVYPNPAPQQFPVNYDPDPVPVKKNGTGKAGIVFLVLFIVALVACVGILVYAFGLQSQVSDYEARLGTLERDLSARENELSDIKKDLDSVTAERDDLSATVDFAAYLLELIASDDGWGYATENFHADKGIMFIDRFGGTQSLGIYSSYYTTFYFELSEEGVISAEWSKKEWNEKGTEVFITPVGTGFCILTFTNDLYDTAFDVLVIVM